MIVKNKISKRKNLRKSEREKAILKKEKHDDIGSHLINLIEENIQKGIF